MHITTKPEKILPFRIRGYELDIFHCSFEQVVNWGSPALRSTFWRCYLPVTAGAALHSSARTWPLRKDEGIILPPDCPVRGQADTAFTLYYVHFNCSIRLTSPLPFAFAVPDGIRTYLKNAVEERNETFFRAGVLQLVAGALGAIPEHKMRGPLRDQRTGQAYRIMKENIDAKLKNADLARQLNMSEASLLRLFQDTVGVPPQKEYLRLRLNHAAALLQHSRKSIEQIAAECGFWDRNHFTRVFTREWKVSPAKYRKSSTPL